MDENSFTSLQWARQIGDDNRGLRRGAWYRILELTAGEAVLAEARAEIWKSWRETCVLNKNHPQAAELFNPEKLPAFHDPFAGGGSIPLEARGWDWRVTPAI